MKIYKFHTHWAANDHTAFIAVDKGIPVATCMVDYDGGCPLFLELHRGRGLPAARHRRQAAGRRRAGRAHSRRHPHAARVAVSGHARVGARLVQAHGLPRGRALPRIPQDTNQKTVTMADAKQSYDLHRLPIWSVYIQGARDLLLRLKADGATLLPKSSRESKHDYQIYEQALWEYLLADPSHLDRYIRQSGEARFYDHKRDDKARLTGVKFAMMTKQEILTT